MQKSKTIGFKTQVVLLATLWWLKLVSSQSQCIKWYDPEYESPDSIRPEVPMNWAEIDKECSVALGKNMLHMGYRTFNVDEPYLCEPIDGLVPLRIRKNNSGIFWWNGYGIGDEAVTIQDLNMMDNSSSGLVAAMDLKTGRWRFVDDNYQFTCGICELLRRKNLKVPMKEITEIYSRYELSVQVLNSSIDFETTIEALAEALNINVEDIYLISQHNLENPIIETLLDWHSLPEVSQEDESWISREGVENTHVSADTRREMMSRVKRKVDQSYPTANSNTPSYTTIDPPYGTTPNITMTITTTTTTTLMTTPTTMPNTMPTTTGSKSPLTYYTFRILLPLDHPELPSVVYISEEIYVENIINIGVCKQEDDEIHLWPLTHPGKVRVRRNKNPPNLSTRECTLIIDYKPKEFKVRVDSDEVYCKAIWLDVNVWSENWEDCTLQPDTTPNETISNAGNFIDGLTETPVLSRQLDEIADVINGVLRLDNSVLEENSVALSKLVRDLQTILTNMILDDGSDVVQSLRSDIALVVSDIVGENPVIGISLSTVDADPAIEILRHSDADYIFDQTTEVGSCLSLSLVELNTRLAFTAYPNGDAFIPPRPSGVEIEYPWLTNSRVLDIVLVSNDTGTVFPEDGFVDMYFKPVQNSLDKKCAYWDYLSTSGPSWSTQGCTLIEPSDIAGLDLCRCYHLTNFAEIITGGNINLSPGDGQALDIISIAGCILSLISLCGIGLTAICFKHWRRELSNKILLNMSAAIALNLISFLLIASIKTNGEDALCIMIGVLNHYSVLACFTWMLVMSGLQLLRIVTILGAKGISFLLLKATVFAWCLPLVPVTTLLAIDPRLYTSNPAHVTREFCYPQGLAYYLTVLGPVSLAIFTNLTIFIIILIRIHSWCGWGRLNQNLERHGITDRVVAIRRIRTMVFLFLLFGLTWIFGLFAFNVVFAYLFCITATLQGVVLFVFFVLLERKTSGFWRMAVKEKWKRGQTDERDSAQTNTTQESKTSDCISLRSHLSD